MVLTELDQKLIAEIQDGLPLVSHPYAVVGEKLGISEADAMQRIQNLMEANYIKRMGVVVRHRALGYTANAMVVWDIPDDEVAKIGALLAGEECVTLCYQRPRRLPDWPYNLFCMIHGRRRDSVLRKLKLIVEYHGLQHTPHEVLFSKRSFKQRGAHYIDQPPVVATREKDHG